MSGRKSKITSSSFAEDGVLRLGFEPVSDQVWTFKPTSHQIEDGFKTVFLAQATWILLKGTKGVIKDQHYRDFGAYIERLLTQ